MMISVNLLLKCFSKFTQKTPYITTLRTEISSAVLQFIHFIMGSADNNISQNLSSSR